MAGESLGSDAIAVIQKSDFYAMEQSFIAKRAFPKGSFVELQADGEVDTVSNPVKALGPVSVASGGADEELTLYAPFYAIIRARANGGITTGNFAKFSASPTNSNGEATFASAASTEQAHGIALEDATDGEYLQIGLFTQPRVAP